LLTSNLIIMKNLYQKLLLITLIAFGMMSNAQSPLLNSYPAAAPTIYLDFDGHTVTGTQWNTSGPIVCGPSNLNSSQIEAVYDRMSEDYRPFNINITTDSAKYLAAPANRRMRLIFTISSSWYPQAVGGVSYINSFTWGDNTPAFIFTAALNYNLKNISEAGSHEAGHTLGLRHQAVYDASCLKVTDYNAGTGSGEIGWAPIMGVGYSKNFTTWNSGPNSLGCSTIQNDLDVITRSANGVSFRTDDYTESFATASSVPVINNQLNIDGVITTTADKDIFKITFSKPGRLYINAIPYNTGTSNAGSDLDMQVQLYNDKQNAVGVYNPAPYLNSVIDTTLDAGTYYMLIDGKGNQYASEYGSLGSYKLQGTYSENIVLPLHKLELKGINNNGMHTFSWEVVADERIMKQALEVSINGGVFQEVTEIEAPNKSYHYFATANGTLQYRLRVLFEDGKQYFSNVVMLRNTSSLAKPQLQSNIIRGNTFAVVSMEKFNYTISDYSGRIMGRGFITAGTSTISASSLANGAYIIRFSNGNEQFVEKFVEQY
jgi:hypothetical protein